MPGVRLRSSHMTLPELLTANASHPIALPTGTIVDVPKATPTFRLWHGPPVADTHNGKQILDFKGRPAFAELVILWSLWVLFSYLPPYRSSHFSSSRTLILPCQGFLLSSCPSPGKTSSRVGMPRVCSARSSK